MMEIPNKIEGLIYSPHALRERCKEIKGFIEFAPKSFLKAGCKFFCPETDDRFRAVYIYDDTRDLHLIINPNDKTVVTNFLKFSDNKGIYKGRFRITYEPKKCTKKYKRDR